MLSITPAFLQVYAVSCGWCRIKDSVVVHEFGEHQPTRTFNKNLFSEVILLAINQGVKDCEQMLGKLTRDLVGFSHDLIEVLDSITEKPFNQVEWDTVSSFTKFTKKYNGFEVADCAFVAKMKDVIRVSRWLNFNKIHPMDISTTWKFKDDSCAVCWCTYADGRFGGFVSHIGGEPSKNA